MEAIIELATTLRRAADLLDVIARESVAPVISGGPELPRLLSYPEAARYLRCGERHFQRLAAEGEVPKIYLGRRVLFAQEDLDSYVDRLRRSI